MKSFVILVLPEEAKLEDGYWDSERLAVWRAVGQEPHGSLVGSGGQPAGSQQGWGAGSAHSLPLPVSHQSPCLVNPARYRQGRQQAGGEAQENYPPRPGPWAPGRVGGGGSGKRGENAQRGEVGDKAASPLWSAPLPPNLSLREGLAWGGGVRYSGPGPGSVHNIDAT